MFLYYAIDVTSIDIQSVRIKTITLICGHNLSECTPIFKILSRTDSKENSLCTRDRKFHLTFTTFLHYIVKFEINSCNE